MTPAVNDEPYLLKERLFILLAKESKRMYICTKRKEKMLRIVRVCGARRPVKSVK